MKEINIVSLQMVKTGTLSYLKIVFQVLRMQQKSCGHSLETVTENISYLYV